MPRSDAEWKKWFERREMKNRKRPQSKSAAKAKAAPAKRIGVPLPRVVGERSFFNDSWKRSKILDYAERRRANPTAAEAHLCRLLRSLNNGVLRGKFVREHVISGKWIVDFFFPDIRLAIEVDGSYHLTGHQIKKDRMKDADCARFDITVLRITNGEVFGDEQALVEKLRSGWREALSRKNRLIGLTEEEYFRRKE